MTARDTIARACFDPGHFVGLRQKNETLDQWRARAVEAALTAAGHRIVGPADMEKAVERLKDAVEGECDGLAIDDAQANAILDYVFTGEPPK